MKLQEEEIKEKAAKLEQAEQRLSTLNLELKVRVCYIKLIYEYLHLICAWVSFFFLKTIGWRKMCERKTGVWRDMFNLL